MESWEGLGVGARARAAVEPQIKSGDYHDRPFPSFGAVAVGGKRDEELNAHSERTPLECVQRSEQRWSFFFYPEFRLGNACRNTPMGEKAISQ